MSVRINTNVSSAECAGSKIDCTGTLWVADFGYNQSAKGSSCNLNGGGESCVLSGIVELFGCQDETTEDLFQCEHSDRKPSPDLIYSFNVPDGLYVLNLFFASTYDGSTMVGDRVFDIYAEGVLEYAAFDQVAAAGASERVVVRSMVVTVADGNGLQFHMERISQSPALKAIELLHGDGFMPSTTLPPTTSTTFAPTTTSTLAPSTTTTLAPTTTTTLASTTTTTLAPTTTTTLAPTTTTTLAPTTTTLPVSTTTTTSTTSTSTTTTVPGCGGPVDCDGDGLIGGDPCPQDARNKCFGEVAVDQTTGGIIRVNTNTGSFECSGSKLDCSGDLWVADFGYNLTAKASACNLNGGGESCVVTGITDIFGCDDEETEDIFQCEHSDKRSSPELSYDFDVPDGSYVVNLYFANTYSGTTSAGDRIFDITIEGVLVYDDFDQVAVGGADGAVVRSAIVTVVGGDGLQIAFGHVTENPAIKGIEILGPAGL